MAMLSHPTRRQLAPRPLLFYQLIDALYGAGVPEPSDGHLGDHQRYAQ